MDNKTILFPKKGITLGDILKQKGKYRKVAAKALGVCPSGFYKAVKKHNLIHLFPKQPLYELGLFVPSKGITVEQATALKGGIAKEVAKTLKLSLEKFRTACHAHKIHDLFIWPSTPKQKPNTTPRKKVMGLGPKLKKIEIDCYTETCNQTLFVELWPGEKPDHRKFCSRCKQRGSNYYEEESQLPRC